MARLMAMSDTFEPYPTPKPPKVSFRRSVNGSPYWTIDLDEADLALTGDDAFEQVIFETDQRLQAVFELEPESERPAPLLDEAIFDHLRENPWKNLTDIRTVVGRQVGVRHDLVSKAVKRLHEEGSLVMELGPRNSKVYRVAPELL